MSRSSWSQKSDFSIVLDAFGIRDTDTLRERLVENLHLKERARQLEAEHGPVRVGLRDGFRACTNCERAVRLDWSWCPHCGRRLIQ